MNRTFTSLCLSIVAAAAFASAASADTTPSPDRITRVVKVSDVDLHSQAGAQTVAHRIFHAADYVCGGDSLLWRRASDFQSCRNDAIDRALASLKAPMVSAALGRQTTTGMASR